MNTSLFLHLWKSLQHIKFIKHLLIGTLLFSLLFFIGYELLQNLLPNFVILPPIQSTVFLDTSAPTFALKASTTSGTISYKVVDSSGASVTSGQIVAEGSHTNLTLPQLPDNYYVLQVTDHADSRVISENIPFAVLSPFTQPADSPFGIGVHFSAANTPGFSQLITSMGTTIVRDDALWSQIELSKGNYSFGNLDPYMRTLQLSNLSPLLILDYNNGFYDHNQTPYDDTGIQAFAHYAQAVVTHYGSQLKAVEVYNEYNNVVFSKGPCARDPACYVRLLRATYQAIKAVRPEVTVIGGVAFLDDTAWFRQVFADGGLAYMDVVSDHPYTNAFRFSPELQQLEEEMQNLQKLIQSYNNGQTKPIWMTEIGWPTTRLFVSEQDQANYVVRTMVLSLAAGVQKIFWYDLLNDGTNQDAIEQNFGLVRQPDTEGLYTPKPAYAAYAVLARELAGHSFLRQEATSSDIYDMLFSGNLHVMWSTPFPQDVVFATNQSVTVTSLTGHVQTLQPVNGKIVLALSAEPIYIQGNISNVSWNPPVPF